MVALLVTCLNMSSTCPGDISVPSMKLFIMTPPAGEMPWHFTDLFRVHICLSHPNLVAIGCCIAEKQQCLLTGHASMTSATNYIEKQMHAMLFRWSKYDLYQVSRLDEIWSEKVCSNSYANVIFTKLFIHSFTACFSKFWKQRETQRPEFLGYVNILAKCFSPTDMSFWACG